MDKRAINKLRKKFILVSFLSFLGVMVLIGGLIYALNVIITRRDAYDTLTVILKNDGEIPDDSDGDESSSSPDSSPTPTPSGSDENSASSDGSGITGLSSLGTDENPIRQYFYSSERYQNSPEFSYQTRYFYVVFDKNGDLSGVITSHIAAVTKEEAVELAQQTIQSGKTFDRVGDYYYRIEKEDDGTTKAAFLDCRVQRYLNSRILLISLILTVCGALASYVVLRIFSYRIVRPEIRNIERQKQFITNASHELKTPLAVIRANTELDMMMNGENEWNQSTMRQVDHMTELIQNLVMIAKSNENHTGVLVDLDVSKTVSDTADTFKSVAESEGKKIEKDIPDGIHMKADKNQITQLTTLLLDNATKYCDENGEILVSLSQKGKYTRLAISNSYAAGEHQNYSRFFDRFYREDEAHTQGKGGYGIGLSIAESLMEQYGGTIDVSWKDGMITFTCTFKS